MNKKIDYRGIEFSLNPRDGKKWDESNRYKRFLKIKKILCLFLNEKNFYKICDFYNKNNIPKYLYEAIHEKYWNKDGYVKE